MPEPPRPLTDGRCAWCDELVDAARMGTHLKKHLDMTITPVRGKAAAVKSKAAVKAKAKGRGKKAGGAGGVQEEEAGPPPPPPNRDAFVLKMVDSDDHGYWMFARAHGRSKLSDLDELLREAWAGCCPDHASHFIIRGTAYSDKDEEGEGEESDDDDDDDEYYDDDDDDDDEYYGDDFFSSLIRARRPKPRPLDVDLRSVVRHKDRFSYVFDDDNMMEIEITVYATATSAQMNAPIGLLARNEPPVLECSSCKAEDASKICGLCIGQREHPWYCTGCINEHPCGDSRALPVENTPRVGKCPYEGLSDKERRAERERRRPAPMVVGPLPSMTDIRAMLSEFMGRRR